MFAETREESSLAKLILILITALSSFLLTSFSKQSKPANQQSASTAPVTLLKRTASRHENIRFGYGGTVTILGAPKGSIKVEGWQRNEIDFTADIEWQAQKQEG